MIPKGPPHIKHVPAEYSIGQWVNLNCTSEPSRPPARLTWIVNNAEVGIFIALINLKITYCYKESPLYYSIKKVFTICRLKMI